jgi:hypothetical protein
MMLKIHTYFSKSTASNRYSLCQELKVRFWNHKKSNDKALISLGNVNEVLTASQVGLSTGKVQTSRVFITGLCLRTQPLAYTSPIRQKCTKGRASQPSLETGYSSSKNEAGDRWYDYNHNTLYGCMEVS